MSLWVHSVPVYKHFKLFVCSNINFCVRFVTSESRCSSKLEDRECDDWDAKAKAGSRPDNDVRESLRDAGLGLSLSVTECDTQLGGADVRADLREEIGRREGLRPAVYKQPSLSITTNITHPPNTHLITF